MPADTTGFTLFFLVCCAPGHMADTGAEARQVHAPEITMAQAGTPDRPHAGGRSFADLDAYLAHLRVLGAQDIPYYHEVSPGRYRLESGRGTRNQPPVLATREELLRKFGFSR